MVEYQDSRIFGAEPTMQLRWLGGRLQQAWLITEFSGGVPTSSKIEWRDVPSEPSDGSSPPPLSPPSMKGGE